MIDLKERPTIDGRIHDEEVQRLVGDYLGYRERVSPIEEDLIEPVGMTAEDEAALMRLLKLADANRDGDEQAAIDRLVSSLRTAPEVRP